MVVSTAIEFNNWTILVAWESGVFDVQDLKHQFIGGYKNYDST